MSAKSSTNNNAKIEETNMNTTPLTAQKPPFLDRVRMFWGWQNAKYHLADLIYWTARWALRQANSMTGKNHDTEMDELLRLRPDEDPKLNRHDMLSGDVVELLDVFVNQGHSGASAPVVARMFHDLALGKPLSPLTGEESEWTDEHALEKGHNQNKRFTSVFKKGDKAYYLYAVGFRYPNGSVYNNTEKASGRLPIESFPWLPKKLIVDVDQEGNPLRELPSFAPNALS